MTIVTSVFNWESHSSQWKTNLLRARDSWLGLGCKVVIVGPENPEYAKPGVEFTGHPPFPKKNLIFGKAAAQSGIVALVDADLIVSESVNQALEYISNGTVKMLTSKRWTYNPAMFDLNAAFVDPNDNAVDCYIGDSSLFVHPASVMPGSFREAHNIWDTWAVGYFNKTLGTAFKSATKFKFLFHPKHEERRKPYGDPKKPRDQWIVCANHPDEL